MTPVWRSDPNVPVLVDKRWRKRCDVIGKYLDRPDLLPATLARVEPRVWLFAIAATLACWQVLLLARLDGSSNRLVVDGLFWAAALTVLWQRRRELELRSDPVSTAIGAGLLGLLVAKSLSLFWFETTFLRLTPLLVFAGLVLVASGWRVWQYGRELGIFLLLVFPFEQLNGWLKNTANLSQLTAAVSNFMLHYVGFDVAREGIRLLLPSGSVIVGYECTGGEVILLLLELSLLFILVFPLTWRGRAGLLGGAIAIGFFLGTVRVGILAVLVHDSEKFDFWHGDPGNQIFSMVAMLGYGALCYWVHETVVLPATDAREAARQAALAGEDGAEGEGAGDEVAAGDRAGSARGDRDSGEEQIALGDALGAGSTGAPTRRGRVLGVAWGLLALAVAYMLLVPAAGARSVPPLAFPPQVTLPGWEQVATAPLSEIRPEDSRRFDLIRSGQEYQLQRAARGANRPVTAASEALTVQLRYVVGTLGNVDNMMQNQEIFPKGGFDDVEMRDAPSTGSYRVFHDGDRAYLSACIDPNGRSVATMGEFIANRRETVTPERLGGWLLGRHPLRDRRCLWAHLFAPLEGQSPQALYPTLETAWQAGYSQWQGLLPSYEGAAS